MQADFPRFVHTAVFKSPVRAVSIGVAKGGKGAMAPPKFLENIVILWFERPFSTQNSVIRLKSNIPPPKLWAGYATGRLLRVAESSRPKRLPGSELISNVPF